MTVYYYQSGGGYYYRISGGKSKRISYEEYKCDYEGAKRNVRRGDRVRIKIKRRGFYNAEAQGVVEDVLTSKKYHSRGKKVRLRSGEVGRVICIYKN